MTELQLVSNGAPQRNTAALLEYYANLSMHHRTMMIGFGGVYFSITQFLLLSAPERLVSQTSTAPRAALLGGSLLMFLILASVLHHACHFCATAAMKAMLLADAHYQYLPDTKTEVDPFHSQVNKITRSAKTYSAISINSAYIIAITFVVLVVTNIYLFWQISKPIIDQSHPDVKFILGAYAVLAVAAGYFYGKAFRKHLNYLNICKNELSLVLAATNKQEVEARILQVTSFKTSSKLGLYPQDQDL